MANKDIGRTSQGEDDVMDTDEQVRGRADEMEDMSNDSDEFEDTEDLDEEEEQGEGSF